MGLLLAPTGYLADLLITKNLLSVTNVRRFFNCGGFIAQTVFMMTAGYLTSPVGIITCLIFGVGLGAFALSGYPVNALDIAPNHAAILMGIANTFAVSFSEVLVLRLRTDEFLFTIDTTGHHLTHVNGIHCYCRL